MAQVGRILTGARAIIKARGVAIGYAVNFTAREDLAHQPANFIGNIRTTENVATRYTVSGSMSMVRIVGETVKSQGLFPKSGNSSLEHLQNVLAQELLTFVVEDQKTNQPVGQVEGVSLTTNGLSIDGDSISGNDVDFVAIVLRDESELL